MTRYAMNPECFPEHLPLRKRLELARIVKVLFEEFRLAQLAETDKKQPCGRILKLILFGSYARGDWVVDRKSGYFSDYDILAVVSDHASADPELWYSAENRLDRAYVVTRRLKAPVELIVHSYEDINRHLRVSRPFFVDIVRDGIMLYEEEGFPLARPIKLSKEERRKEGQEYFDEWYRASLSMLDIAKFNFGKAQKEKESRAKNILMNDAAFTAHQATERIYNCALLTLLLYSPKLHNLDKLRSFAHVASEELAEIWPRDKRVYRRNFELLRRAYVEARYSRHYVITAEELQWLFDRIEALQNKVKEICEEYLQKTD